MTTSQPSDSSNSQPSKDSQSTKKNKTTRRRPAFFWRSLGGLFKWFFGMLMTLFLLGVIVAGIGYFYFERELPDVAALKNVKLQAPLQILSHDGELIAVFGEKRRDPLTFSEIPPQVIEAVIATEDSRFYEHHGVDPIGILRAVVIGLGNGGRFSQGGSTITQQVAKNYFLNSDKKIERKIKEAILALRMEQELSKDEIITLYLNMINFGSRAYGVGAAAQTFFGKNVSELSLSESALLAGLPNAPSAYNPIYHPEKALSRRNWVLYRMLDQEFITKEEYEQAIAEPLEVSYHQPEIAFSAPYIAEMARQYMVNIYGESAYDDGYKVYTTIVRKDQIAATEALVNNLYTYDQNQGFRGAERRVWEKDDTPLTHDAIVNELKKEICYQKACPAIVIATSSQSAQVVMKSGEEITLTLKSMLWAKVKGVAPKKVTDVLTPGDLIRVKESVSSKGEKQWVLSQLPHIEGALVSINSDTGAIDALVGGFDFNRSKFNRATQAIRQIGSTIKPFIYAAALDEGLTLGSIINDIPITRSTGSNLWRPKNSPDRYDGPLRLRIGLAQSKNVMMVRTMRAIGIQNAADYLLNFGFPKENISYNESLALGAASFTPLQVARAYSVIVNGGYLITPYIVDRIEQNNELIYQHVPEIACTECIATSHSGIKKAHALGNTEIASSIDGEEEVPEALLTDDNPLLLNREQNGGYAPQMIGSDVAFLIKDAMHSVIYGGKDFGGTAWRSKALKRPDSGGKTGTTNGSKDVWFAGYVGERLAVVWMGFDDHRYSLKRASGGTTANPVWNEYMNAVKDDIPVRKSIRPNNIIQVRIDAKSGLLSLDSDIYEYYIKGTQPTEYETEKLSPTFINEEGESEELF